MSSSCMMESSNLGRCVSLSDREYPLFSPSIEWQSPWISFADDRPKLDNRKERSCSQDFEFSLFSTGSGMISADEIFCNGKMLPYNLQVKPQDKVSRVGESMQDPSVASVRRQNSMPARVVTTAPRSSTTTSSITCSSRWKEIFNRFRRNVKKDYESDLSHGSDTSFQSGRGNDFHCSSKRSLLRSSSMSCEYEQGGDFAMEPLVAVESRSSSAANSGPLNEVAGKKPSSNSELKATSMKDYLDEQSSRKKRAGHSHCGKQRRKAIPDGKGGRDSAPRRNTTSLDKGISGNASRVYPGISRRHASSDGSDILTQSGKRKESLRYLRYGKDGWVFCESQPGAYTSNVKVTPVLNMPVCMGDSLVSSRVSKFSFFDLPRKKKLPK